MYQSVQENYTGDEIRVHNFVTVRKFRVCSMGIFDSISQKSLKYCN